MKKTAAAMSTAALALMLTACTGGGPSKSEAEQALGQFFQQAAGVRPTFENLALGDCEKAGEGPGYACSVSATVVMDAGGRVQREPLSRTFVFDELDGQWKVVATR